MAKKERPPIEVFREVPLRWPEGWTRTLIDKRKHQSAWKRQYDFYMKAVRDELTRINVQSARISHNELGGEIERRDPGVAVWFAVKVPDDFSWQIGLKLDNPTPTVEEIEKAYRELARKHHPDSVLAGSGGDPEMFKRLGDHRKKARAWVMGSAAAALDNCIPCDRFDSISQNVAAIRMALAAFRQLERVGIPAILERVMGSAFKTALPAPGPLQSGAPQ